MQHSGVRYIVTACNVEGQEVLVEALSGDLNALVVEVLAAWDNSIYIYILMYTHEHLPTQQKLEVVRKHDVT